ncbi:MAG: UDP-3-O-(3-hydroxymyristoyl)glucosamine N-acyltransferase, partial [Planctomycetota bacterium]|nr:UDP-3-O-(3-hydroxymyristoyl)glucosamine N-acyltransferase [Planctomycetota bacterium]
MSKTLGELARLAGGVLEGDPSTSVEGVAGLQEAGPADVAFVASPRFKAAAAASMAACLVVPQDWKGGLGRAALLKVADPNLAMVAIAAALCPPLPQPQAGVHPQASVAKTATLGKGVHVGACAVVGERAKIGDRTRIRA